MKNSDMIQNELIEILNTELDVQLPALISTESLQEKLTSYIDHLIQNDFQKLVLILYKVDVDERKLKTLLKNNETENASEIIAKLIMERELQKIKSRREFNTPAKDDEAERW